MGKLFPFTILQLIEVASIN